METVLIQVDGMHCGGCASSVSKALLALDGVAKAEVSHEKAQAQVQFDAQKVSTATLLEAVEEAGFDAAL